MTGRYFFSVILLICVATAAAQEITCPYIFVTKTGTQPDGATRDSRIALTFDYNSPDPHSIPDISLYNFLGPDYESFQSNAVDVFTFEGRCEHYCEVAIYFYGASPDSSWTVQVFMLRASLTETSCDFTKTYDESFTLSGELDYHDFNFCDDEAGVTKKQNLTEASRLRLFGKPSYTT